MELQGLLVNRTQPRFDSQPAPDTTVDDLDEELVADYIATARATDRGLARISDNHDLAEWSWSRAIELRITDTQLRLVNPGGLYGITVARLFDNQLTSARNLTLTRICQYVRLRDARVVEALATGMPKILASTIGDGLPRPQFFDQAVTFTAILTRPSGAGHEASAMERRGFPAPTPAEQRVLEALEDEQRTQTELATELGLSDQAVLKHLRRLRSIGLVVMDGGPGHRVTTYRRT